ncbi:unnamed protein product, partial [Dibothriocephalus latus]
MHPDRVCSLELGSSAILSASSKESAHPLPEHWLYTSQNGPEAVGERTSASLATLTAVPTALSLKGLDSNNVSGPSTPLATSPTGGFAERRTSK